MLLKVVNLFWLMVFIFLRLFQLLYQSFRGLLWQCLIFIRMLPLLTGECLFLFWSESVEFFFQEIVFILQSDVGFIHLSLHLIFLDIQFTDSHFQYFYFPFQLNFSSRDLTIDLLYEMRLCQLNPFYRINYTWRTHHSWSDCDDSTCRYFDLIWWWIRFWAWGDLLVTGFSFSKFHLDETSVVFKIWFDWTHDVKNRFWSGDWVIQNWFRRRNHNLPRYWGMVQNWWWGLTGNHLMEGLGSLESLRKL